MKRSIILTISILVLIHSLGNAQKFQAHVNPGYLNVNYEISLDTLAPSITIFSPKNNIIPNLPIFIKSNNVDITGEVIDDKELESFVIEGSQIQLNEFGKFEHEIKLRQGPNRIVYSAQDKKGNKSDGILDLYQDDNADLDPPDIEVIEPLLGRGIDVVEIPATENIKVKGKINDATGIYELSINENKISCDTAGIFNYEFKKNPGAITIKVIDVNGNLAMRSFTLGSIDKSADSLIIGKYHALIIAIEDYQDINIPDLDNPVRDAKNLKNALVTNYTFEENDITFLENPNREQVITTLSKLENKLTENDNLLIFYAGHGYWDSKREQGYWLPIDARSENPSKWISNSDIRDYIKAIETKHTLLIADACFSGGIFKTRSAFTEAPTSILESYKYSSRKAMTSGTLTEVPDKSEFVRYLVKRLEENNTKFVPAQSLFWSFRDAVVNSGKPTPFYGVVQGAGDEGLGDFIFVHK